MRPSLPLRSRAQNLHLYETAVVVAGAVLAIREFRGSDAVPSIFYVVVALLSAITVNIFLEIRREVSFSVFQMVFLVIISSQSITVSPKLLIVAALSSAMDLKLLRSRRSVIPFNVAMFVIYMFATLAMWHFLYSHTGPLVAAIGAATTLVATNFVIIAPAISMDLSISNKAALRLLLPQVPVEIAFGTFAIVIGYLIGHVGVVILPLAALPVVALARVLQATASLDHAHIDTEAMLLNVLKLKDEYTYRHSLRVAKFARYIAEGLNKSEEEIDRAYRAGLMHDIGKVHTKLKYLNKPGPLDAHEWAEVKKHTHMSKQILLLVQFLQPVVGAAADGHAFFGRTDMNETEHWVEYAVSVADGFDAMTSTRAYRKALPFEEVVEELRRCAGYAEDKQFSPQAVEALLSVLEERGEKYGQGYEDDIVEFAVEPPKSGFGSAGLGKLAPSPHEQKSRERFGTSSEPIIPDQPTDPHQERERTYQEDEQ